ncbi:MAG TPA: pyridoxal phosphate-dependent aminotransferase [Bryobacteraceae bacterium]|nr:pyridoxal phosphate-dependent aminotransferase [Bryobacteraceae bacterium]
MSSYYMPWAKLKSHARFNIATSGVAHWKLRDLPVKIEDLEISGPSFYGFPPLQQALAKHCGVTPDRIVAATGTSMANYLALSAVLQAGDEVLIEEPTYELILAAAEQIGASISRFRRTRESGFALDPAAIERAVTPQTKLIIIGNLHNPSSALTDEATIQRVGEIARRVNARVLVDEVYLDAAFEQAPRSAALLGDQFIVTSSLTKVYGLSGLRCGWIIAEPELAQTMWRLNDLFGVIPAHMAELVSVIALGELPRIRDAVRRRLDTNRAILNRFFDSRAELELVRQPYGTIAFPKLLSGDVDRLCDLLRNKYETTVVPGKYFEMPDHFRIGIGGDPEPLEEALRRLGMALDDLMESAHEN